MVVVVVVVDIWTSKSGLGFLKFDLEMCLVPQRLTPFRHLNFQKWPEPGVLCTFWLGNLLRTTRARTFSTSQLPKVVWAWCALYILTWKMCFAPQRRALFRHLNFQKWSGAGVFCTFWLGNVLRAPACTFSTAQLPKVVLTWGVFRFLTWKCASRHNCVQFFISGQLAPHPGASEVTFRPSGAPNHWKDTVNHDFPTYSRTCIFFLLTFSISYLLTSWLLLSDSSHLCFSISAYCRKFDF